MHKVIYCNTNTTINVRYRLPVAPTAPPGFGDQDTVNLLSGFVDVVKSLHRVQDG